MLAVTGFNSKIVQELLLMLPEEDVRHVKPPYSGHMDAERYLLCAGVIHPKTIRQQTQTQIRTTMNVNLLWPMQFCERILEHNDHARICVLGSESGYSWSYDGVYAASKAALHQYVETKKLKPDQQLVCLAPSIIADTGMTQSRTDIKNLAAREKKHPKGRFLKAAEVARAIYFLLYQDRGYITGTVVRMNGGGR